MSTNSQRKYSTSSEDSYDEKEMEKPSTSEASNIFRNDGSFLEMFKKMQQAQTSKSTNSSVMEKSTDTKVENDKELASSKVFPVVGKRRCPKILPVGKVKKTKPDDENGKPESKDAWAKYLEEVKKYKETYCESEAKTRSLVK